MKKIVIVGGGAGGLILATRLAKLSRRSKLCSVTLIDASLTHMWKPLLHEIAAGTLNSFDDELSYTAHAALHHYDFQYGRLTHLDRGQKTLELGEVNDDKGGVLLPARKLSYDLLVMAIGSIGNDFGIPGVSDYAFNLDSRFHAEQVHKRVLSAYWLAHSEQEKTRFEDGLHINIVGGGATGVELAAEFSSALPELGKYGLSDISADKIKINLIEAGDNLLPGQQAKMVRTATKALEAMKVNILYNTRVTQVAADHLIANNTSIPSFITVWASGVKCSEVLSHLDGLETNKLNQIVVNDRLQSSSDESIYALGDCSELMVDGKRMAPRAQVAQQQAVYLAKSLMQTLAHQEVRPFAFNDKGSFVSLGRGDSAGTVLAKGAHALNIEGLLARWAYVFLYRKHQLEILGLYKTTIFIIKDVLTRIIGPKIKLH